MREENCYAQWMDGVKAVNYDAGMEAEKELTFQSNLVKLRNRTGMTQEQLAELLCVSRNAIAKWEAGLGIPCVKNLIRLRNHFRVSLDTMLFGNVDVKGDLQNE